MKEQIHLFTGENTYELQREIRRWKEKFAEKHGEENMNTLDGKKISWKELLDELSSSPFIAEKRLVIIDELPAASKEEMESLATIMHEQVIALFICPNPDARTSITKWLKNNATVHVFEPLKGASLNRWMQQHAGTLGTQLSTAVIQKLFNVVGDNQWHLDGEIRKLVAYAHPNHPSPEDIEIVCVPTHSQTVWTISDYIGKRKHREAALFAATLWERGEDSYSLWSMYVWIARMMITTWLWHHEKNASLQTISKEGGVPFLSAKALLPLVQTLSERQIRSLTTIVSEAERDLKSGGIRASAEDGTELITMLERCVLCLEKA